MIGSVIGLVIWIWVAKVRDCKKYVKREKSTVRKSKVPRISGFKRRDTLVSPQRGVRGWCFCWGLATAPTRVEG